jgi:hypothetical protein
MGNLYSESTAESNFGLDPEAAYIVLKKMKVPITVVTWESAVFVRERVRLSVPLNRALYLHADIPQPF